MLAKCDQTSSACIDTSGPIFRLAMFNNMLDHIVPILIHDHITQILEHFLQDWTGLVVGTMLKYTLDHTASVRMCRQTEHLQVHTLCIRKTPQTIRLFPKVKSNYCLYPRRIIFIFILFLSFFIIRFLLGSPANFCSFFQFNFPKIGPKQENQNQTRNTTGGTNYADDRFCLSEFAAISIRTSSIPVQQMPGI